MSRDHASTHREILGTDTERDYYCPDWAEGILYEHGMAVPQESTGSPHGYQPPVEILPPRDKAKNALSDAFVAQLREAIQERGETPAKICRSLGWAANSLSKAMRQTSGIRPGRLKELLRYLGREDLIHDKKSESRVV